MDCRVGRMGWEVDVIAKDQIPDLMGFLRPLEELRGMSIASVSYHSFWEVSRKSRRRFRRPLWHLGQTTLTLGISSGRRENDSTHRIRTACTIFVSFSKHIIDIPFRSSPSTGSHVCMAGNIQSQPDMTIRTGT